MLDKGGPGVYIIQGGEGDEMPGIWIERVQI